jgi:ubiquinone/menaquinone biosynthesis C-methylase UbiE
VTQLAHGSLAGDAIHQDWVAKYRTPEAQPFYELAFDEIVRQFAAPRDAVVLDAGCGSCAKSVLLAARGMKVVGADFADDALALASGTVRARGFEDRITLRQADLTLMPFADGEFRYVVCWGVLMHIPNLDAALAQLARVLAPGGVLVISEGNVYSLQSYLLRFLKRVLGKGRGRVVQVPAGLESFEDTEQGPLVTRQTDMCWMVAACERLGLRLRVRRAGQFTELYTLMPWPWLRRAIHAFNNAWFRVVKRPGPAFGNMLVFEKVTVANDVA